MNEVEERYNEETGEQYTDEELVEIARAYAFDTAMKKAFGNRWKPPKEDPNSYTAVARRYLSNLSR